MAPVLILIPPPGAYVRPPLPPPLPWQFLHHLAGCAPEIPQSAAQEQERLRLGLCPPARKGLLYPMCCLRGWGLPRPEGLFCSPWVLWALWAPKVTLEKTWACVLACGELGASGLNKGTEAQRWLKVCGLLRVRQGPGGALSCHSTGSWGS